MLYIMEKKLAPENVIETIWRKGFDDKVCSNQRLFG